MKRLNDLFANFSKVHFGSSMYFDHSVCICVREWFLWRSWSTIMVLCVRSVILLELSRRRRYSFHHNVSNEVVVEIQYGQYQSGTTFAISEHFVLFICRLEKVFLN